jgi:hypothetical protein
MANGLEPQLSDNTRTGNEPALGGDLSLWDACRRCGRRLVKNKEGQWHCQRCTIVTKLAKQYHCPIWETKEGEFIPLKIMSQRHLDNLVRYNPREYRKLKLELQGGCTEERTAELEKLIEVRVRCIRVVAYEVQRRHFSNPPPN